MPNDHADPPDWLKEYGETCIKAFGLQDWDIHYCMERTIGGNLDRLAHVHSQYEYEDAGILFRDNLQADREGFETLTHEHLHLTQANMEIAVGLIIGLVPDNLGDHAKEIWRNAVEQDVTRLARSLTRVLMPKPEEEPKEKPLNGKVQDEDEHIQELKEWLSV